MRLYRHLPATVSGPRPPESICGSEIVHIDQAQSHKPIATFAAVTLQRHTMPFIDDGYRAGATDNDLNVLLVLKRIFLEPQSDGRF
jgi:hypothetical protein